MAIDLESFGGGGITGLFVSLLTAFGIKGKVDRLEEKKQDKSICEVLHKSTDEKFISLEKKLDTVIEGQSKVWDRLDNMNDFLRNQK